jgi:hypothetical protein
VSRQQIVRVYDSNTIPFEFHIPNVKYLCCFLFRIANILHGQNMLEVIYLEKKIPELDVLFNSIGCYCKLTTIVVDFISSREVISKYVVEFVILGDYLKPKIDANISLLDITIGYLFTYALDFFKLWYTHNHMS